MKPRLLDLFCGAGGAAVGYHRAGFEVVGVDIEPQPRYPFEFHRVDAIEFLGDESMIRECFDAIHASPPCQHHSLTKQLWDHEHPDLVGTTRGLLQGAGLPYVIENVKAAPLIDPQVLEGQMFGLNTHRPRLFETNWGYQAPVLRHPPPAQAKMGRPIKEGEAIQVVGHFSDVRAARAAMGIDWMTQAELAQAIPPAYTEHIGYYLRQHLDHAARRSDSDLQGAGL